MRRLKIGCPVFCVPFTLIILLVFGGVSAQAQGSSSFSSPTTGFFSQGTSAIGSFFSQDLPGALDASMPLLFPPYFGGEVRVRPYFYGLINGQIEGKDANEIPFKIDLEGTKGGNPGISLSSKGSYVELMGRFQLSRLSLRVWLNKDIRRIPAGYGKVGWIDYGLGLDFDIINSYGITFGINGDFFAAPDLFYNDESGLARRGLLSTNGGPGKITGSAPLTYGIHISYNPFNSWIVSPTLELRCNWPYQNRPGQSLASNDAQLTQWEWAAGIKLPKTVIGSTGIRIGHRDSYLQYGGAAFSSNRSAVITIQTGGYFGDLVWFY